LIEATRPAGLSDTDSDAEATPTTTPSDGADGGPEAPDGSTGSGSSGGENPPPGAPTPPAPVPPRKPRVARSLIIGSVIAIGLGVFLFVVLPSKSGTGSSGPLVGIGTPAPNFTLPSLAGGVPVNLDALGKDAHRPVILNFFASWCIPCQKETPLLARTAAAEQARGGPIRFVGVDVNDPTTDALPFVQKSGIAYPVGVDRTFRVTSARYGLYGLPQTFFIDSNGTVIGHKIGAVTGSELQGWVHRLAGSSG
jgi:cytochrome c biogenesis protein CcmG/thiol:disulfide interchange protein DsbE